MLPLLLLGRKEYSKHYPTNASYEKEPGPKTGLFFVYWFCIYRMYNAKNSLRAGTIKMRQTDIPSILQYVLGEQGRANLEPEETALMQVSAGLPVMVAGGPDANKRTWLQRVFGTNRPMPSGQPQSPQDAARPAEGLVSPGSVGDQIRKRREAADQAGGEVSVVPSDMVYAQNDTGIRSDAMVDPYGGTSIQTRAAMHELGKGDPNGEFADAVIGKTSSPASSGYAARTTTRGAQTSKQEQQLINMLIGRGMSPEEARARAKSIK